MLAWFDALDFAGFLAVLTAANVGMYLASWAVVAGLQRAFPSRVLNAGRPRVTRREALVSLAVVAVNIGVGVAGWPLWKRGIITLREAPPLEALLDLAVMVLFFDLSMYALHRLVHVGWLFEHMHRTHHRQVDVSGVSFFIMNPLEAVGFGALLVGFLALRSSSIHALLAFLTLNWAYGTMGHSGLRYRARFWRWCAGDSEFHQLHHEQQRGNYGFFTPIWDHAFGSLARRSEVSRAV